MFPLLLADKLLEVTKLQHTFGAQRAASMQAEFKDIRTGNKGQDKFRVSEEVEGAFLRSMSVSRLTISGAFDS